MFGTAIFLFMCAIIITFREKKILAENRDINSKLKDHDSYSSLNRAGLLQTQPAGRGPVYPEERRGAGLTLLDGEAVREAVRSAVRRGGDESWSWGRSREDNTSEETDTKGTVGARRACTSMSEATLNG